MTLCVFLLGSGRGGMTSAAESLRHPVSIRVVVLLQHRYVTYGLMNLGPPQTGMHVDDGRHVWLRRLRHMVTLNLVTPVTPNTVTPHGYAKFGYAGYAKHGYSTWLYRIWLRYKRRCILAFSSFRSVR